jgi:uncharacterized membrane protein YhfC
LQNICNLCIIAIIAEIEILQYYYGCIAWLKNKIQLSLEEAILFKLNIEFCQLDKVPNPNNVSIIYGKQ